MKNTYEGVEHLMDEKIVNLENRSQEEIDKLYEYVGALESELNEKVEIFKEKLKEEANKFDFINKIYILSEEDSKNINKKLYKICVVEIKAFGLILENYLDLDGWKLQISCIGEEYSENERKLIKFLEEKNVKYSFEENRKIRIYSYNYNEEIANIVNDNIRILKWNRRDGLFRSDFGTQGTLL